MAATSPQVLTEQRRRTPAADASHVDTLTGYRGLAALVVLVVHGAGHTAYPHVGVHGYGPIALFVLSGYLLITPWSRWSLGQAGSPDLRTFARRRVARIFPAYLLVLFVVALIYPASRPESEGSWLRAITLTNFLGSDGLRPAMQHTWSMGTEFSWYLALPLIGAFLAFLGRRVLPRSMATPVFIVLVLAVAINIVWSIWVDANATTLAQQLTWPMWLPSFLACFTLGATVRHMELVARTRPHGRSWLTTITRHWWVPALVGIVALGIVLSPLSGPVGYVPMTFSERSIRNAAAATLAVTLLISAVASSSRSPVSRVLSLRPMVAIGRWSYGIYLWHLPVTIMLVENMTVPSGPGGFVLWIGLILSISATLGALTYAFVEQPAIAWSKRSKAAR